MTSRVPLHKKLRLIAALVIPALSLVTGNMVTAHTLDIIADRPDTALADTEPVTNTLFMPLAVKTAPSNQQPATPASPLPVNDGLADQSLSQLAWEGGDPDGDPVTYRVTLEAGDTTPDRQIYAGANTACSPGALAPNTRYHWQVTAEDVHGATTAGPVWTFMTAASTPAPPPPDFATEVVILTNAERAKASCPALAISLQLTQAAQDHSTDMAINDYFSHYSLDGRTPWDRIRATGYSYARAAENIAAGYNSPASVVAGWMNSDGHRANILNCALTEIGVGYTYLSPDIGSVNYHHYWTQVFATPQ